MSIEEIENDIKNQFISLFDSVRLIANYGRGTHEQAYKLLKTQLLDKQIYLLLVDDFYLEKVNVYADDYAYDGKEGKYITITFICQQLEKSIQQNKTTDDIANYGFGAKKFYYSVQNTLDIYLPESLLISAQSPDCYHDLENPLTPVVQQLIKENKALVKSISNNKVKQLPNEYLTINEAINHLDRVIANSHLIQSAKVILEDSVREYSLSPVYYFDGYAVLYRYIDAGVEKTEKLQIMSTELKQVLRIKGYFYDSETHYGDGLDNNTYNSFFNLDDRQFAIGSVIPEKVLDVCEVTTHQLKCYANSKYETHRAYQQIRLDKVIDFDNCEVLLLSRSLPNIDEELTFIKDTQEHIEHRNIYFKSNDILKLSSQLATDDNTNNNGNSVLKAENEQLKKRIAELEQQLNQIKSNLSKDKELTPKDSAYHLIAVLKDLLLNPDINAYHFKTDNNNSTNQPTQTGLAEYIDAMDVRGLKTRNINGILSEANRLLEDIKKS